MMMNMISEQPQDVRTKKPLRLIYPKLTLGLATPPKLLSVKIQRTYKCSECAQLFCAFRQLKLHENTHELDSISVCKYCCSLLVNDEALHKHKKDSHADSKFVCLPCGKRYKHKGYLLKHIANTHNRDQLIYYCSLCPREELPVAHDSKLALQQHFQAIHLNMPIFEMNSDDNIDMNEEFLDEFLLQGSNENSFEFSEWDLHLPDELPDNQQPTQQSDLNATLSATYKCSNCYEMFANQKTLFAHLAQTHNMPLLICNKCDAKFQNMEDLTKHKTRHRSYDRLMQPNVNVCKICEKACRSTAELQSHIKTHFNKSLQPHTCPYCSKPFQAQTNLKQHLRVVHTHVKKHTCFLCDRQFSTLDHLKKHVLSQHQNERKHVCNVCSKRFTQLCHLKQHSAIHTTGKKVICNTCSATFWRKIDLERHLLRKHVKRDNNS